MQHGLRRKTLGLFHWQWLVLAIHFAAYLFWMGNAVFYSDDGVWLSRVQDLNALGWDGVWSWFRWEHDTLNRRHPLLAALLHLSFYKIYPSVKSILVGVALVQLAAQALLFKIGNDKQKPLLGLFLVALFFWSPALLVYYSLRVWQLSYFLFFCVAFCYLTLEFAKTQKPKFVYLMAVCAAVSMLFHASGAFLLTVPVAYFVTSPNLFSRRDLLLTWAAVIVVLLPWWVPVASARGPAFLLVLAIPFFVIPLQRLKLNGAVLLALAGLVCLAVTVLRPDIRPLFANFFDLLSAPNPWLDRKMRLDPPAPELLGWISLFSVLWITALASRIGKFRSLSQEDKALVYLNVFPLCAAFVGHLPIAFRAHHYLLFAVVPALLLLSRFLLEEGQDKVAKFRRTAAIFMVVLAIASSMRAELFLTRSGGRGEHCSTLGEKLEMVDYFGNAKHGYLAFPTDGKFSSCIHPMAYMPLLREAHIKTDFVDKSQSPLYLVTEPYSSKYLRELYETERAQNWAREDLRSIRIYQSDEPLEIRPTFEFNTN